MGTRLIKCCGDGNGTEPKLGRRMQPLSKLTAGTAFVGGLRFAQNKTEYCSFLQKKISQRLFENKIVIELTVRLTFNSADNNKVQKLAALYGNPLIPH